MKDLKELFGLKRSEESKTEEERRHDQMVREANKQVNRNRKKLLLVVVIAALILAWYIKGHWTIPGDGMNTCVLSINCTQAYEHRDLLPEDIAKQIKKKGRITSNSIFVVEDGETLKDLLTSYGEKNKVDIRFDDASGDIEFIKYIGNGDAGDGSRWTFTVNGETVNANAAGYAIQHDDEIVVSYEIKE